MSFLGFTGYYRRFIYNYATIIAPLQALTHHKAKWIWSQQCANAFTNRKTKLLSKPILTSPSPSDPLILDCDASNTSLSAVLSQVEDGQEKVIAHYSYALKSAERSYCTTKRELLAVVLAIRKMRDHLSSQPFTVRTDHAALQWLLNFKDTDGILARWLTTLSKYSFILQHRPGKNHSNANALSRRPPVRKCPKAGCDHCRPSSVSAGTTIGQVMARNVIPTQHNSVQHNIPTWLGGYTLEELSNAQRDDPVLKKNST